MIFRTLLAFISRDFRQTMSYKFAFLLDVASIFFNAATFFFVSKLFESSGAKLEGYGGTYFPFVLVGIAFSTYQTTGLTSFSQSLRQEQYMGTFESILASPVRIPTFLAGSALWDFAYATFEVVLYFTVAAAAFGFTLYNANFPAALLSIIFTLSTFMGLGVLAAAFIMRFKRGNPITWALATASELFGGVYFPPSILPDWMKNISDWMPMTHALTALRQSLLADASVDQISSHLLFLGIFTLVIWPIGIGAFQLALKASQRDGSLGHY